MAENKYGNVTDEYRNEYLKFLEKRMAVSSMNIERNSAIARLLSKDYKPGYHGEYTWEIAAAIRQTGLSMLNRINCDYDGCADPITKNGNYNAMFGLVLETREYLCNVLLCIPIVASHYGGKDNKNKNPEYTWYIETSDGVLLEDDYIIDIEEYGGTENDEYGLNNTLAFNEYLMNKKLSLIEQWNNTSSEKKEHTDKNYANAQCLGYRAWRALRYLNECNFALTLSVEQLCEIIDGVMDILCLQEPDSDREWINSPVPYYEAAKEDCESVYSAVENSPE